MRVLSLAEADKDQQLIEKGPQMEIKLWTIYSGMQRLIKREEGQDLIEYALVVALIAFAAIASMQTVANDINLLFAAIGNALTAAG